MPAEQKPEWLTVGPPKGQSYQELKDLFRNLNLHTVCEEAHCPNVHECWGSGTATLMLMGDTCSRACRFCMVTPGKPQGALDQLEPENVAFALSQMGLTYVVLTSVDRDDLTDGGASHFARTISLVKEKNPGLLVEVLIPDFQGELDQLKLVVDARPDVIAHNIETTMSLTPSVRDPRAHYWQSLSVLKNVKKLTPHIYTKSSIMVGLGESEEEVKQVMVHLRQADVDFLTVGQYLRPSSRHLKVVDYVHPDQFERYRVMGEGVGFRYVASGPLVRSSYKAGEYFIRTAIENDARRRQSYMTSGAKTDV
ncbi:MAG TPA: lipoyl synthase [Nitrososphaerales archaeon]|nr:lipoyl synthase [Nitrososphaerales archaeon]